MNSRIRSTAVVVACAAVAVMSLTAAGSAQAPGAPTITSPDPGAVPSPYYSNNPQTWWTICPTPQVNARCAKPQGPIPSFEVAGGPRITKNAAGQTFRAGSLRAAPATYYLIASADMQGLVSAPAIKLVWPVFNPHVTVSQSKHGNHSTFTVSVHCPQRCDAIGNAQAESAHTSAPAAKFKPRLDASDVRYAVTVNSSTVKGSKSVLLQIVLALPLAGSGNPEADRQVFKFDPNGFDIIKALTGSDIFFSGSATIYCKFPGKANVQAAGAKTIDSGHCGIAFGDAILKNTH